MVRDADGRDTSLNKLIAGSDNGSAAVRARVRFLCRDRVACVRLFRLFAIWRAAIWCVFVCVVHVGLVTEIYCSCANVNATWAKKPDRGKTMASSLRMLMQPEQLT